MYKNKIVNVTPTLPIPIKGTMITGVTHGIELSVGDISMCICRGALVDEVFQNGQTVRLSLSNYNKDNTPVAVEEKKKEEPKQTQAPQQVQEQKKEEQKAQTPPPAQQQAPTNTNQQPAQNKQEIKK